MSKKGLFKKYIITKANGNPVDPDAVYFVLRLDTDPHAEDAAEAYAASVKKENPDLASDLLYMLENKSWDALHSTASPWVRMCYDRFGE